MKKLLGFYDPMPGDEYPDQSIGEVLLYAPAAIIEVDDEMNPLHPIEPLIQHIAEQIVNLVLNEKFI